MSGPGEKPLTMRQVRELHPMPWRYMVLPGTSIVVVLDQQGKEVQLFTLLNFACLVTQAMAAQPEPAAAAPAQG